MGILQTSLPRKNDLSLDKLLLGFILGEKYTYIEINAEEWLLNLYQTPDLLPDWWTTGGPILNVSQHAASAPEGRRKAPETEGPVKGGCRP